MHNASAYCTAAVQLPHMVPYAPDLFWHTHAGFRNLVGTGSSWIDMQRSACHIDCKPLSDINEPAVRPSESG
jgi:hypothetical protein